MSVMISESRTANQTVLTLDAFCTTRLLITFILNRCERMKLQCTAVWAAVMEVEVTWGEEWRAEQIVGRFSIGLRSEVQKMHQ